MRAVLAIDIEPDGRTPEPGTAVAWAGAEALLDGDDRLRTRLGTPVINWFLRIDEQVEVLHGTDRWAAEHFGARLEPLVSSGDEIGVHPHGWRLVAGSWVADSTDQCAVENAERALEGYRGAFGSYPPSFRYGDRVVSNAVIARLLDHPDVRVDLTLEPGPPTVRALATGYRTQGVIRHIDPGCGHRYRPALDDVEIADSNGSLTMVPLTMAVVPGSNSIDTLQLWRDPEQFAAMLELRLLDDQLDHLAFAVRSEAATIDWAMSNIAANLGRLAAVIPDLEWVRASELALGSDEGAGAPTRGPVGTLVRRTEELELGLGRARVKLLEADVRREREQRLAADALAASEFAADALATQLQAIEATMSWRVRQRLLPVMWPLSRVLRSLRQRVVRS